MPPTIPPEANPLFAGISLANLSIDAENLSIAFSKVIAVLFKISLLPIPRSKSSCSITFNSSKPVESVILPCSIAFCNSAKPLGMPSIAGSAPA